MQMFSFVSVEQQGYWLHEWKHYMYILVMQCFWVVCCGISHASLVFSWYMYRMYMYRKCLYQENTRDEWDIPRYTVRKGCITIIYHAIDLPQVNLKRIPWENVLASEVWFFGCKADERVTKRSTCLACKVFISISRQKGDEVIRKLNGTIRRKQSNMFGAPKLKEEICLLWAKAIRSKGEIKQKLISISSCRLEGRSPVTKTKHLFGRLTSEEMKIEIAANQVWKVLCPVRCVHEMKDFLKV